MRAVMARCGIGRLLSRMRPGESILPLSASLVSCSVAKAAIQRRLRRNETTAGQYPHGVFPTAPCRLERRAKLSLRASSLPLSGGPASRIDLGRKVRLFRLSAGR